MAEFVEAFLPVLSNLFFLLPADRALRWGRGFRSIIFFIIVFASSLYHMCVGFPMTCVWSFQKHHVIDFWTAEIVIPVAALYFIRFRAPFVEKWLIIISIISVGLLVTGKADNIVCQAGVTLGSFVVVGIYLAWYVYTHGYWPDYDLVQLTLGVLCTVFSISFFVLQNYWPDGYWILHSFWHAFGALGQYFILGIRPPANPLLNLEGAIPDPSSDAALFRKYEVSGIFQRLSQAVSEFVESAVPTKIQRLVHPVWEKEWLHTADIRNRPVLPIVSQGDSGDSSSSTVILGYASGAVQRKFPV